MDSALVPEGMYAAYITEPGPPESIRCGVLPVPVPGPTDVLVAVEAVAVNPVDAFVRSGHYRTPLPLPFVIGRDLVGRVVSAGPGVVGISPGQWVWCNSLGYGGRQGSFAQYAVVPGDRCYALPYGVDPIAAVAVFHPAATAHLGLARVRLSAGQTIYVGGGAGSVGTALTVLASRNGARVITSARADDAAWCKAAGADAVLEYASADLGERLRSVAPDGVDAFWDTSGHHDLDLAAAALAARGTVVLMAGMSARPPLPVGAFYTKDATLLGFAITNATVDELASAASTINTLLADDALPVRVGEISSLDQASRAHRVVEDGGGPGRARGRIVLQVNDVTHDC